MKSEFMKIGTEIFKTDEGGIIRVRGSDGHDIRKRGRVVTSGGHVIIDGEHVR
jgi:hypothetical protein